MEILFREHPRLPPLSWAAEITPKWVTVHHGSRLEHGEDWLVDGCWPGPFEAGLPEGNVDGFFAFSLKIKNSEVWIECPTHPLERLCLVRTEGRVIASPSIPFALSLAGLNPDPGYLYYVFDFLRVICHLSENCRAIPLAQNTSIEIIANRRIIISGNLQTRIEYRPLERSFDSYRQYVDFLKLKIESIRDNILSPARQVGDYGLASSISSGYDSAALNVLAAPLGWKECVTFSAPGDEADSGIEVGERLGMRVQAIDRHGYRRISGWPEAEFLATGTKGEDVVFSEAAGLFKNRLVITGTNGGEVWDKNIIGVTAATIFRRDASGCALGEFRWRVGFLHFPAAHLGGLGLISLKTLSNSREMEPWSVGGEYDRPIPRRILEEAGVPRGSFARKKIGMISVSFSTPDDCLRRDMNSESFAALKQFAQEYRADRKLSDRAELYGKYALYRIERFIGHRLHQAGIIDHVPNTFDERHRQLPGLSSYLFQWSVSVLKQRYCDALQ